MTPRQIELVRSSFAIVEPIADVAATIFYRRLFDLDPALRDLFPADLTAQRRNLMQTLTAVVRGLDRHTGYGVRSEHFETVGAALLETLEEGLGTVFTGETRDAWAAAYGLLAGVMQEAGAAERSAA